MVKVHGFFGVGRLFRPSQSELQSDTFIQDEQLYISDPKALQSILIKDQDAFEETDVFIECVIF